MVCMFLEEVLGSQTKEKSLILDVFYKIYICLSCVLRTVCVCVVSLYVERTSKCCVTPFRKWFSCSVKVPSNNEATPFKMCSHTHTHGAARTHTQVHTVYRTVHAKSSVRK